MWIHCTDINLIQANTGTSRFIVYAQGAMWYLEETTNAPLDKWIHYAFVRNGNNSHFIEMEVFHMQAHTQETLMEVVLQVFV